MNLAGPLTGIRVIELCDEKGAFAGKLFADMGADVIKVEHPTGDQTRAYGPFLEDTPGPERSLWFWQYNTSKRGVTLDLDQPEGQALFRRLAATADIFFTTEPAARLAALGIDYDDLQPANPGLIMVSITPFGRHAARNDEPATDLTLAANGGFAWMNGYDDHSLPPVRGGGHQAYHTGAHFAVMSALTAILARDAGAPGQLIDVNINAAINVTTEAGSYTWLVSEGTVQRQTGRHAGVAPSMPSQVLCADGRYVNTGIPPRKGADFVNLLEWMTTLGLTDQFPLVPLLELGAQRERIDLSRIAEDAEVREIFGAGRQAFEFVASSIPAYDFFTGGQQRGFQVGIIYPPEEVFDDPHFIARGWPVQVEHPELGKTFTYPGAPISFGAAPWRIARRAPLLGEDNAAVWGEVGLSPAEIDALRSRGTI
jgi:crotonobetainyl-CoA:carnitine CoA-transferase CaiB-like acyl-CoA transferase